MCSTQSQSVCSFFVVFKSVKKSTILSLVYFVFISGFSTNLNPKIKGDFSFQDPLILGINCGGGQFSYGNQVFIADKYATGNGKSYANNNIVDILNTDQDDIFFTERSANNDLGSFGYAVPITNGTYTVKLHFAEIYFGATGGGPGGNGKRIFSVAAENNTVLSNYDIYAEVGAMTAVTKTYTVTVIDQMLNLDFSASVNQPKISAIEILGNGQILDPNVNCIWNPVANSSVEKLEAQSAKLNNKLYVFAGLVANLQITGATEIYDVNTNIWTQGQDMPVPVTHMGIAVIGDEIWIVGGFVGNHPGVATNKVQIYNTITNQWRDGVPLPNPRGSGAAVYNNGKLHFFGGLLPDRNTDVGEHFIFDPNNQSMGWQPRANLPNPRNHLSGASVLGKVYAIGGQYGHDNGTNDQNFLHMYDPELDVWVQKANLLNDRSHFEPGTEVYEDKIIIVGGRNQGQFFDLVTEYNPFTNTWKELCPLEDKLLAPCAKVFDDKLFISNGGRDGICCPLSETKWLDLDPFTLSNDSPSLFDDIKLYPNAATTEINFSKNDLFKTINFEIYTVSGQLVKSVKKFDSHATFSVSDLSKGLYLVKLSSDSGNQTTIKKLVIK